MHQIQIFLPTSDPGGQPFDPALYDALAQELTEAFGGLTAYTRSPAQGRWTDSGRTEHDDIVIFEVMTSTIHHAWWQDTRHRLERTFRQTHVLIRAQPVELL
jgi:hypothetical protein